MKIFDGTSCATRAMAGIETFVFGNNGIRVQTVRCTLESIVGERQLYVRRYARIMVGTEPSGN
jgi:hypothetical protein